MIEKQAIAEQLSAFALEKRSPIGRLSLFRHLLRFLTAGAILLILLLAIIAGYSQNGLWMRQRGYNGIFWKLLSVRWTMLCTAFVVAFLYLRINLKRAARSSIAFHGEGRGETSAVLPGARCGCAARPPYIFAERARLASCSNTARA